MRGELEDTMKRLIAELQVKLADLLNIDLDLAFTFLETAALTAIPQRRQELIQTATRALESIRYFVDRVTDPTIGDPASYG